MSHFTAPAERVGEPYAPSPVTSLEVILGSGSAPDYVIMIVRTYIDESGTHGSPYIVMGGYVATLEQWAEFEAAWPQFLAKYRVKTFHSKDIRQGKGAFAKMPLPERREFIDQAEKLANYYLSFRFIMYLGLDEYREHYAKPEKGVRRDSAYGMCFRGVTSELPRLVEKFIGQFDDLQLVLEGGHKNVGDVVRIHSEVAAAQPIIRRSRIGALTLGGKDVFGLHVADAMAFAGFRDAMENDAAWAKEGVPRSPFQTRPVGNEPCPLVMLKITPSTLQEFSERQSRHKQRKRDYWNERRGSRDVSN